MEKPINFSTAFDQSIYIESINQRSKVTTPLISQQTLLKDKFIFSNVKITRVLVGVKVAEIVALLAELNLGVTSAKLFHQEAVVSLHDLPDQLSWNCCHFET